MSIFSRMFIYYLIVFVVWSVLSMITGKDLSLPLYIFIPLVLLVWGLAYYQTKREQSKVNTGER
ncbi:hypothetical protein [Paenibacillus tengchongensis]|uniref:hypothetical protein n=1 Tax=Paenibacillus tengchongensis TaxID=2608684 RepID=UPI00124EB629|nr:hypothetical protein [Paenibacillus tengchongensis]